MVDGDADRLDLSSDESLIDNDFPFKPLASYTMFYRNGFDVIVRNCTKSEYPTVNRSQMYAKLLKCDLNEIRVC